MAEQNPSAKRDAYQNAGEGDMSVHSGSGDLNQFQQPISVVNNTYYGQTPVPAARNPAAEDSSRKANKFKGMWKAVTENGRWYFLVSIISTGIMAFIPFIHAAIVLKRKICYIYAATFGAVGAFIYIIGPSRSDAAGSESDSLNSFAVFLAFLAIIAACILLSKLRKEVYADALKQTGKNKH